MLTMIALKNNIVINVIISFTFKTPLYKILVN